MNNSKYLFLSGVLFLAAIFLLSIDNQNDFNTKSWEGVKIKESTKAVNLSFNKVSYETIIEKNIFHPERIFKKKEPFQGAGFLAKDVKNDFKVLGVFIFGTKKSVTLRKVNEKDGHDYVLNEKVDNSSYKVKEITSNKVILIDNKKNEIVLIVE